MTSVLGTRLGESPAKRGSTPGSPVYFSANVSLNAVSAGTAALSDAGTPVSNSLRRNLQNHDTSYNEELGYVADRSPACLPTIKDPPFPSSLHQS